ncbi:MAG: Mitochondrial distribution and morphology protein 31, mitochondrial precursor [Peltula sp. TS41687]|nr:MAG: Mitochondrial distribution and morphology protein 31, mitochondrial precursor [Peltula sp. TS41687]
MLQNVKRRGCVCLFELVRPQLSGPSSRRSISITARPLGEAFISLTQRPHRRLHGSLPNSSSSSISLRQIKPQSYALGSRSATDADALPIRCSTFPTNRLSLDRISLDQRDITWLAQRAWRRSIHSSLRLTEGKEFKHGGKTDGVGNGNLREGDIHSGSAKESKSGGAAAAASSATNKNILERLPHLHRPTKEELLAAATGFWSRQKIRFKWFSIRSLRPFNTDDISAFFSWFLVGHVIWILLGTTTFFSLAILAVNTVVAQETLARWVGNYLTKSSGVKVVFESAIVPKWKDGVITFRNVFVSRRPGQGSSNVSKGSQITAAAAAAVAAKADPHGDARGQGGQDDTNYTQFDLTLDTVNVTLSFARWFNGKGLLRDVEVKGIRGVVDRTSVHYDGKPVDPRSFKHEHHLGDFEISSFKLEDLLVTVYQPREFRPFSVSIFSCELPRLRKQWLFYDFLSANNTSGSFDESLFTIHPRQIHGHTGALLDELEATGEPNMWKKQSRLRIDGLNIDHLNRGVEGPFSWIHEGSIDIVADIMFPADHNESIAKVMSDVYDRVEATVTSSSRHVDPSVESNPSRTTHNEDDDRFVIFDLRVHLNNVRAAVPLFTKDISYVKNAMIRPIVAYINSKNAFIPVNCRLVKRASDFDGSWTVFDSGLMEDLSAETYDAFTRDIVDEHARRRRFKKVGLWSLQVAVQALFMGLAGNVA